MRQRAFTLIELLVVIAVIGMLASIVLVSLKGTREKGELAVAQQFHAQVVHALGAYAMGIWRFEESSPGPSLDSSGYGNHGTWSASGITSRSEQDCMLGKCLEFDGSAGYVQAASRFGDADFTDQAFTVSAWVKLDTSAAAWNPIAGIKPETNSNYGVQLAEIAAGHPFAGEFIVFVTPGGARIPFLARTGGVPKGVWNHIAFTYDGSGVPSVTSIAVYVNGERRAVVGTFGASFSWFPTNNVIRIGAINTDFFHGLIDEFYIFERAFTAAQVRQLYAKGVQRHQLAQEGSKMVKELPR